MSAVIPSELNGIVIYTAATRTFNFEPPNDSLTSAGGEGSESQTYTIPLQYVTQNYLKVDASPVS